MRKLLILSLLILSFQSKAQLKHSISFSPFTLLYDPIVRVGYELQFTRRSSAQVEVGYGKNISYLFSLTNFNGVKTKSDYYKYQLRASYKLDVSKFSSKVRYYLFIDGFINQTHKDIENGSYTFRSESGYTSFERADMVIQKYGFNTGNGLKTNLSSKLYLDIYFGLGEATRTVEYENIVNPETYYVNHYEYRLFYREGDTEPISKSVLSVKAGINLAYRLSKN